MHRSESNRLNRCAACNAEIDPSLERAFGLGAGVVLCFACAVSRGGSYDEADDRWVSEPDTSGLEAELD